MGKSSKPLVFAIESSINGPTFDALRAQGHTIVIIEDGFGGVYDEFNEILPHVRGIFGPKCWRMDKRVADDPTLFDAALKSMREIYTNNVQNPKVPKAKTSKPVKAGGKGRKAKPPVESATSSSESGVREADLSGPSSETGRITRHGEVDSCLTENPSPTEGTRRGSG